MRSPAVVTLAASVLMAPAPASLGANDVPPQPVLVVGDSLAVGLEPTLGALVAPRAVVWDVRAGRTTPEGLVRLRAKLRAVTPGAVLVSLGTNDGPRTARFR